MSLTTKVRKGGETEWQGVDEVGLSTRGKSSTEVSSGNMGARANQRVVDSSRLVMSGSCPRVLLARGSAAEWLVAGEETRSGAGSRTVCLEISTTRAASHPRQAPTRPPRWSRPTPATRLEPRPARARKLGARSSALRKRARPARCSSRGSSARPNHRSCMQTSLTSGKRLTGDANAVHVRRHARRRVGGRVAGDVASRGSHEADRGRGRRAWGAAAGGDGALGLGASGADGRRRRPVDQKQSSVSSVGPQQRAQI